MSRAGVLDITWFSPTVSPTNALGAPGGSTLALAAGDVFVGGGFTALGTASPAAVRLVRLSGTTGSLVQNFAADATVHRLRAATDGRTVFVGGAFTTVAGSARNRLAAITVATNASTDRFSPSTSAATASWWGEPSPRQLHEWRPSTSMPAPWSLPSDR